ncbi:DUF3054 domain-containing protein [Agrococcus terreus]|uniref:DUF3054 domain-containing protein n=1 Tax=Agrococcus terreus TaxID=574649 RepID=A0ABQ2KPB9_9MICO|nr:DUF3054 domain-containing protein [Agrococcus terreus]GGN89287.1 hypothetical protein GCM10010968_25800 [Agrococcus terreus]
MTETPRTPPAPASGRDVVLALVADVASVLLFAAVGLASHNEGVVTPWGVGQVALPFLVALALGWAFTLAWRAPLAAIRTGVPVWLVTVLGGMLGRFLLGQGTAVPFVIVATITLLVLLVGWRLISGFVRGRRRPSTSATA